MKFIIFTFLLFFSTNTLADKISDIQIEGISIGESLMKYMSKKEILQNKENSKEIYFYLDDTFFEVYLYTDFENYEYLSFFVKSDDKNFLIQGIFGNNNFKDIDNCFETKDRILAELDPLFTKSEKITDIYNVRSDPSGKSKIYATDYILPSKDYASVECYDFHEDMQKEINQNLDSLIVSISTNELFNWLNDI